MDKTKYDKLSKVMFLIYIPFLIVFLYAIFAYKKELMTKEISTIISLVCLAPIFLGNFLISVQSGKCPLGGMFFADIEKNKYTYLLTTSFWGLMALVAVIVIIIKI
jgi:cytochrome oxidase assembly protein ShyY1